ncbi:lytic transglycosylase domain-containing protein [Phenylobacterium sp.]|jgi:soluble lytic murein transglycosylase-like protein|uniref:lytic transglycosylase domain-containing protein n=1 Tax=Phenylobacterium sp. TaxID=1871053 RepID=UPI002E36B56C|nr:lytic transglycosylase domain-containing protein [Phenylobacterium sp.]HEX2559666.1 lytic transglycosylase domain-containing protein [Phenylobacterium sp.]
MTALFRALAALLFAGAIAAPGPAWAQDWRAAGGPLFPGRPVAAPAPEAPTARAQAEIDRVPEPLQPFAAQVADAAARHGLDPKLLHALVLVESAYNPQAVSPAGAAGLAQLMPATGAELGVADRFDPAQSLEGGAAYLARQVVRFGDLRLALAAYNAGPARVARLGRVPAIPETEAYVTVVLECYLALAAGRSVRSARGCRSPG